MQKYNIRLQICVDFGSYSNLIRYMREHSLKNESHAIRRMIKEVSELEHGWEQATRRLNEVIQSKEDRIRNLEFEIRQLRKAKIIKEGDKNENKSN